MKEYLLIWRYDSPMQLRSMKEERLVGLQRHWGALTRSLVGAHFSSFLIKNQVNNKYLYLEKSLRRDQILRVG